MLWGQSQALLSLPEKLLSLEAEEGPRMAEHLGDMKPALSASESAASSTGWEATEGSV